MIVYGLPQYETQEAQATYDGNPAMSPQIEKISSRLRQNETFDFLGDGCLCAICAKLDLCRSAFNVNDNNAIAAVSATVDGGTTSMPYDDSHTSTEIVEVQVGEVQAPSLMPATLDGGRNARQGVWEKVRSAYKRKMGAKKLSLTRSSQGHDTHERQELPSTATPTPLATNCTATSEAHLTSRDSNEDISDKNNKNSGTLAGRSDNNKEGEVMPLGPFRDVFERQTHCALCRLVVQILDEEHKLYNGGAPIEWGSSNAMAEVALAWTRHEDILEINNKPDLYRLRVQVTIPNADGKRNPRVSKPDLKIEPFSAPDQEDAKVFMGRVYGEGQIDVALLKTWIQCCNEWHAGECKTSFRARLAHPAAEFTLYGIDVQAMQLKTLADGDRYCALSYVWGRKPFYRLLAEDLPKLLAAPGSIDTEMMDKLPQTIVGTIGLARDFGIPYLWVDSICIPQDDDTYKAAAIGKMHLVYSKAELTIVAASGPDSFYGLPGYGGIPRDVPQPVQRVKLKGGEDLVLGVRRRYQSSLAISPHGERGWTYQEMCFSTRCLVFLNGTVYFQCRQALWHEDWTLEHPTAVDFFLHEMDNRFMERTDLLGQFRHSLREYTRRKLTYQDDAVNAYAGVLEAQSDLFGGLPLGPVCCGLHILFVDWVILFYHRRGSKRQSGLPSWSWAGWVGETFLPYPFFGSFQRMMMWVQAHCPAAITHFENLGYRGMPDIKHVLRVETLSAALILDPETLDGPGFLHPLWMLRDCRGRACGFISLDDSTFWDAFPSVEALVVEVLVLSDKLPGQGQYPSRGSDIPYDSASRNEDGTSGPRRWQVAPFTGYEGRVSAEFNEGKPFDQYNVIVVVPTTTTVGETRYAGFHERIGVGVIHNQALSWAMEPGPSKKELLIL